MVHANNNNPEAKLYDQKVPVGPKLKPNSKWKVVQRCMRQGKLRRDLWNDAGFMGSHLSNGYASKNGNSGNFDREKMLKSIRDIVDQMAKNKENWMRVATVIDKTMGVVYFVTMGTADFILWYTLTWCAAEDTSTFS